MSGLLNTEEYANYHITGNTSGVQVSDHKGRLGFINFNTIATNEVVTVYDCATVAGIAAGNMIATITTSTTNQPVFFGGRINNGIIVVIASSAGTPDITVVFY